MSQDKKKPSQAESIPKGGGPARSKGTLLSLESRLMFDAAAAATAAEVNQEQVAQEQAEAAVSAESSSETQESTASQDLLQAFTTYLPVESRQEIAFIDPTVPNYQALLSGMDSSIEIIMLDGGQDGIEQMASALAERTGIDAIHVISHGDPGTLQLGTGTLTVVSMAGEYADELATIKQALSEQADLLVYGCDFAEGDAGQVAVNQLATLTGADVQASSDLTGNLALGGDWELEFQIGTIETQVAVSDDAQMNWVGLLAETWMDAATGNVIAGPVGNDWYVGDSANNTPVSSAGGADIMYGAGGDDTLTSGSGNDILVGGTGNDTISGGSDDDVILGGTGNDHLDGGSAVGKNTLIGGGGNDQMVGGSGADVFRFTGAQSGDAYTVDGGGSTDIIDLSEFSTATITNSGGVITVDRGGGNVFTITHANVESIVTAATVGNHGPLADAGSDQTVATSATVTLTAAGSSDRDGNSLTYQWTQIEGPKVTLSSSTAASPTFTAPSSTTTLQFVIVVSDGTTSHADTVTINVTSNSAPTITSNSGGATAAISVAENTTSVTTVTATDANAGQTLTYSISGGADAAKFSINSSTGALSFASAPNYESPTDSGGNNVYDVTVQVSDGQGGVDSQAISVTVTDAANEAPTDLSSGIELNIAGGNDAFLISDTGLPQSLTATTVEIRFAANDTPYEPVFISFNNPTGDELAIQIDEPSKNLEIDFGSGAVASASAINYRAALVDGAVHTLSVTWENTTGNWGVYIDGVFIDSGTGLSTGSPLDTTNGRFVFGQEQDAQNSGYDSTQYFSGTFYDVRIWNDVRTAGEIAQYYQQQLDVTPAEAAAVGLVANWQMDGFNGSNQVVEVVSGNNLSIAHASGTGFTAGAADSQLSIQENSANGSHIGFVTSEDPDASETFSYSLTDSASGRFAVNSATGEITVANGMLLDYDTATSHNITVRVTDSGGLTYDETFTINLTNVNETPTDLSLSSNTVAENAANGTVVGTVSGSDPDSGDTKTYSLTDTAGGRFAIDSSTGVLTVADGSLLDFENGASHTVTVRVTDSGGLTYDEVFTINVTNVNEAPVAADDRAGLTFDGVDDFVHMGSGAVYEVTDTVTMEAWINREPSSQVSQIIINKEGEYEIGLDADGSLKWAFANTNPGWAWHDTGVVIPVHAWTHIAVTYDHGTITSYVNGVVVETFAGSGTIGDAHPTKDSLRIGGRENNPANQYFSGQIAEVQVWNVSRTAGEIAADLNGTLTGSETGLLGYWKFNENTGATADNLTGNSDGTLGDGILGQTPQWATYRVTEDTTLVSSGSGVLGNDYDIDGDALSAIIDTGPSHASAFTLNADGSFSYTPAANFYGTDSFTYRVSDGTNLSNVATVYIQVDPVNDVPSDLILSTNTVVENASNGTVVGSVGGTDPDSGDTMTYSITDSAGGRFAINSSTGQLTVADGSLLNYESATSHNITVRVTDAGGLTYDETFTINVTNVNEAPTGADTTITINEDTSHTLTTGNFGFSDVDVGDGLSAVRIDTLPTTGNLTLSGVAVTAGQVITVADIMAGNLVFTPAADTNGTGYANFTFSVRDSNNAYDVAPNTLTFDVTPVNDAPIRTSGTVSNLTVSEDAGLASLGLAGVTYSSGGSTDESGQTLTYAVTVIPSPSAGDVFLADGTTRVIVGSYTLAEIQGMQFKPATNATGVTAFQFNVYDSGGTANGGADTISEFILITVTAVNDAPTITNLSSDSLSYNEGDGAVVIEQGGNALVADVDSSNLDTGTLVVSIPSGGDSAEDVLSIRNEGTSAGQIGVSGSNVTYGGVTIGTSTGGSSGSNLVITLNSNATPTAVTALVQNITYENTDTAAATTGARTVRFVLTDGDGGTSANYDTTVTVSGVNDAPVNTVPGAQTVNEDTALAVSGISVNDVDGNLSSVQLGVLNGTVSVILQGGATISGGSNSTNTLTLSGSQADINATLATLTYQGTLNYNGSDTLTVTSTDSNSVTDVDMVAITVSAVDDATVVTGGTSGTGNEDTTITGTLTATDADGLSDGTVFTVSTNATNGTASIDPATGLWSYTPNADYNGTDSFTVTITDDAGTTTTHVISVTVTPVNDAPVMVVNSGSTVAEGGTDTIDASELAVTDVDNSAAQLTYSIGTGPLYGRLELTTAPGVNATTFTQADIAANRLIYIHDSSETTNDSFTFTVSDGAGGSVGLTTVTLTITSVNDTPTITSGGGGPTAAFSVAENVSAVTIVTGADVDLPVQALTYSLSGGADQARFTINTATGALNFTVSPDFEVARDANGDNVYVVQVQVTDNQGASTTQTIQVTVTDVLELAPPAPPSVPTVPPVLLSPTPPSPAPTGPAPAPPGVTGLSTGSSLESVTSVQAGLPGPNMPPVDIRPMSQASLTLVPPSDRPVVKLPEEVKHALPEVEQDRPIFLVSDDQGRPLFSVLPVEPAPTLEPEAPKITPSVSDLLMAKLDEMAVSLEEAVNVSQERHELMARVAAVTGTTLSVGFVAWALRSGAILASMLATMPAWQHFDPLPVVKLTRNERKHRRDEATRAQQQEAAEFKGLNQVLDKAPPLKRTA